MKVFRKLFLFFAMGGAIAAGCAKKSDIDDLQKQIDAIKSDQIQTVSGQISAIQTSITSLKNTDNELQAYISTLMTEADKLESADKALEESIAKLKEDLKNEISSSKADALKQLENLKATIGGELTTLKAAIEELKKKDAELQNRIDELKAYIDNGLKDAKDWAKATFATLDQYNATAAIVATIQTQIASINSEMSGIKATMASQKAELDKSIADLDSGLRAEIKSAADAASTALEAATDEITKAYTAAIAGAISASESSIKSWVNEQLTGYYTIAQMDSKLEALQAALEAKMNTNTEELRDLVNSLETRINAKIAANEKEIQDLKTALADQKTEITEAYTRAIIGAITANNGNLDAKLQTEIGKVNDKIAALAIRLTAVENRVSSLTNRVDDIEEGLKSLTSIAYIPKYSDGIERVEYEVSGYKFTRKGDLVLRFDVYPESAAQTIADSYATTLSARAVYTLLTRANAGDFTDLQITDATATGGILSVTVSSSNLDFDFLTGNLEASLVLKVRTGYNNLQSTYIPLVATGENLSYAQYVLGSFDTDGDEDLSETELAAITQMDLTRCEDITALDLTVFPNLSKVNCPSLDWLRKLAPAYNVTTVFYSADGASRLYSEDDILIDGIVWQKKNVGAASAEELGVSAIYADALNSTCPEGYHLPWKAEFDALARNYSSLIKLTNVDGRWFSGSRVWSEGSDVPAIFLPGLQSLPFSRYWVYTPGGVSAVMPVFFLAATDPSQRHPKGWWQTIQAYEDSNCTQIRCVKD